MRLNMSIQCYGMVLIAALMLHSCKKKTNESISEYQLRVLQALGLVVPIDTVVQPRILPFENYGIVSAIERKSDKAPQNVHPIKSSKTFQYCIPNIVTPGQDMFSFPKKVIAIDRPVSAGLPMIFSVQEVNSADPNLYSFSSFNKLQGLNNARVQYMSEDILGI